MTGPFIRFGAGLVWQQAQAAMAQHRLGIARAALANMRADRSADGVHWRLLAAQIASQEGRIRDAGMHALDAAGAAPTDFAALCAIATILINVGERVAARDCLDRLRQDSCGNPLLLMHAAELRKRMEQPVESLALLDQAHALGPPNPALSYCRGVALIANGRLDAAESELVAALTQAPQRGVITVPLVRLRRQTAERNILPAIENGLRRSDVTVSDRAAFEFARYKTLEDLGRHKEAGAALGAGNALMYATLGNDGAALHATLNQLLAAQHSPDTEPTARAKSDAGSRPVFIVGMPRSGTTLLERMLSNHPSVQAAGELVDFRLQVHWLADSGDLYSAKMIKRLARLDYAALGDRYLAQTRWRANGSAVYLDKQPSNWMLVGAIHAALPHARILNLVRDPIDTCFSNWRIYFGEVCGYSYDLSALADYYCDYHRAMAYWRRTLPGAIMDVRYAELVDAPEVALRRVFEFCGVPWHAGCSNLALNRNPSTTPSAAQVRGPLTRDNAGRWRHYARQLGPLLAALDERGLSY